MFRMRVKEGLRPASSCGPIGYRGSRESLHRARGSRPRRGETISQMNRLSAKGHTTTKGQPNLRAPIQDRTLVHGLHCSCHSTGRYVGTLFPLITSRKPDCHRAAHARCNDYFSPATLSFQYFSHNSRC